MEGALHLINITDEGLNPALSLRHLSATFMVLGV